jgi:hypothetical protein
MRKRRPGTVAPALTALAALKRACGMQAPALIASILAACSPDANDTGSAESTGYSQDMASSYGDGTAAATSWVAEEASPYADVQNEAVLLSNTRQLIQRLAAFRRGATSAPTALSSSTRANSLVIIRSIKFSCSTSQAARAGSFPPVWA